MLLEKEVINGLNMRTAFTSFMFPVPKLVIHRRKQVKHGHAFTNLQSCHFLLTAYKILRI